MLIVAGLQKSYSESTKIYRPKLNTSAKELKSASCKTK